jgi:acyl-CoA reductase-like NAD-dependent aldehyde dehydrogenase
MRRLDDPVGVVAAITPSNWPFALSAAKIVPALLAGNGVVVKPAPTTPLTVLRAVQAIADCFPPGLISVVTGEADVIGARLVDHPLVRMVSFTGGIATGRLVGGQCARTVKTAVLELGGNDAALLLEDVEVDDALCSNLVAGAFTTTGQVCFAIKRLYVPSRLHNAVLEGILAVLDEYVEGPGLDQGSSIGPLHSEGGRHRVEGLVAEAEARGSMVHRAGTVTGDPERGFFLQPCVVTGLDDDAGLVAEEQFGPALPLLPYLTLDEAIERINASEYGLCSSVWTPDEETGVTVARRIQAGTTFINNHGLFAVDVRGPYGGVKQSGIGREMSVEGLIGYTEPHLISTRHL